MRTTVALILFICSFFAFGAPLEKDSKKELVLNTAADVGYLNSFEKEIIYEINLLRSNPAQYATNYIAPLAKYYKRKIFYSPHHKPIKTSEGVKALNECVRFLQNTHALPIIFPNSALTKAANDHVNDQSKTGRTGHIGSDRSGFKERMERYGDWKIRIAENIAYGNFTARQIIIYLLIDDGIKSRGHRKTFLNPDYKTVGIATGSHPEYGIMSVMDFAGSFAENHLKATINE